jgi:sulfate transport system substrate-binding protein
MGDVMIAWENEAFLAVKELGPDKLAIVVPSGQHPGRAAGDHRRQDGGQARHAGGGSRRTSSTCTARKGRKIAAKHYYRPRLAKVASKHAGTSPR